MNSETMNPEFSQLSLKKKKIVKLVPIGLNIEFVVSKMALRSDGQGNSEPEIQEIFTLKHFLIVTLTVPQIKYYYRSLNTRIYKTNYQFWAVLSSWGCREKKLQTAISMQLLRSVFYVFIVKKTFTFFEKNIVVSALK